MYNSASQIIERIIKPLILNYEASMADVAEVLIIKHVKASRVMYT